MHALNKQHDRLSIFKSRWLISNYRKEDIFVVFLIVYLSGNRFLDTLIGSQVTISIIFSILAVLAIKAQKKVIVEKAFYIYLSLMLIFIAQSVMFEFFPTITIVGFFIKITIAYLAFTVVDDFVDIFILIMRYICLAGVSIWAIGRMGLDRLIIPLLSYFPIGHNDIWKGEVSFITPIHTFLLDSSGLTRNCGVFSEPGAFASYIILATTFLILKKETIDKKNLANSLIIFIVSLFSAMSTAGVIAIIPLLVIFFRQPSLNSAKKSVINILIIPSVLILSIATVTLIPFVGEKIVNQISTVDWLDTDFSSQNTSRFASAVLDMQYFEESPFIGNGIHEITRYRHNLSDFYDEQDNNIRGHANGLTEIFVSFGIIGSVIIFWHVFLSFKRFTNQPLSAFIGFLTFLIILSSQPLLNFPFWWILLFLGFRSDSTNYIEEKNQLL